MAVTIDGVEIPEQEIQAEMDAIRAEYNAYVTREGGEPDEAQLREWALETLIEAFLLRREAAASQPMPSDERVRQELEKNAEDYAGVPEAERPAKAGEALQRRRLMREIRKKVKRPEEAEVRAFYDAAPALFMAPEALRLTHICLLSEPSTRANDFLMLLRVKTDVEQGRMAWEDAVAQCSHTFERDYGFFATVTRGELPPDMEDKLFALKQGEISEVLDIGAETLHLFKVMEILPPGKIAFKQAREVAENALFDQACQDALNEWFDAQKAKAVIAQ